MIEFNTRELSIQDSYRVLSSLFIPRPIAWVSTLSKNQIRNLAPFSFSMAVASKPFTLAFAPMFDSRRKRLKDTVVNLSQNPDCVIHIVSENLLEQMNQTSAEVESEIDEFLLAGLSSVKADVVNAYRITEALIAFEARMTNSIPIGQGEGSSTLILVEVEKVHVADSIWDDSKNRVDVMKLRPVSRLAGNQYSLLREIVELPRP